MNDYLIPTSFPISTLVVNYLVAYLPLHSPSDRDTAVDNSGLFPLAERWAAVTIGNIANQPLPEGSQDWLPTQTGNLSVPDGDVPWTLGRFAEYPDHLCLRFTGSSQWFEENILGKFEFALVNSGAGFSEGVAAIRSNFEEVAPYAFMGSTFLPFQRKLVVAPAEPESDEPEPVEPEPAPGVNSSGVATGLIAFAAGYATRKLME